MLLNRKIRDSLKDNLLLLVHHHADVDSVASAIALKTVFSDATISASDGISVSGQNIAKVTNEDILADPPAKWDGTVIALDSPNPEHCSPVPESKQIIVIDHHDKIADWPEGTEIIHLPHKTSTAEIIFLFIQELGLEISKDCATVLLSAIYTDTGQFRHANNETFGVASELCNAGADPQEIINILDRERPLAQKIMFLKAGQRMKWLQEGKWIIATSRVASFESGSARLLIVLGADVAIVASENKKGEMRLSTRASNRIVAKGFNLTKVLESIEKINGGSAGGHPGAAGYNGKGDAEAITEIAKQECISLIRELS
ncbi:MAG: DHH family phosphoesterase [Candidatus Thermoplasmatota archaeon]|nr:DHH family phosphoesterase [Candidatus Thermoplasmatota archaeon]